MVCVSESVCEYSKSYKKCLLIIKEINREYGYPKELPKKEIMLIIGKLAGIDKRTKNNYFSALIDYGFIINDRGEIYKINNKFNKEKE